MKYIVKGSAGHRRVAFACPRCGVDLESPLEEAGDVYPCPTCGGDFTTPGVDDLQLERQVAARAAERDAKEATLGLRTTRARLESGDVPEHVGKIIATNPMILLSFVVGVFWPFGTVLVLWTCWRLLDALEIRGKARSVWLIGCGVPLIGLLVLKKLVDRAAKEVDEHRPGRTPLNDTEEAEYRRAIRMGRTGMSLAGGISVVSKVAFAGAVPLLLAPLVLLGIGMGVRSAVKRRPYVRKLRDHGYVKLWFATSNPIGEYDQNLPK